MADRTGNGSSETNYTVDPAGPHAGPGTPPNPPVPAVVSPGPGTPPNPPVPAVKKVIEDLKKANEEANAALVALGPSRPATMTAIITDLRSSNSEHNQTLDELKSRLEALLQNM